VADEGRLQRRGVDEPVGDEARPAGPDHVRPGAAHPGTVASLALRPGHGAGAVLTPRIDLTLDCAEPGPVATFWKVALGYEDEPPPPPFRTRDAWLASSGVPASERDGGAWLRDPAGRGARLSILRVPEAKVAKNRLHLDVRVAGPGPPEVRWRRITDKVDELLAAGGAVLGRFEGHHVVMADPEGNELCIC
jgi:hypothetical protein